MIRPTRQSWPPHPRPGRSRVLGLAVLLAAGPAAAAPATTVLVWPRTPATAVDGVDAALRTAGHRPHDAAAVRARLLAEDAADAAALRSVLAAVERALADARAAWLAQRHDDAIALLTRAEADAVRVLRPGPACAATMWELEFQLGLAYHARGDADAARRRFALALALDPDRRPPAGLYGPDVGLAFLQAVDAVARRPARPLRLAVAPPDAAVAIDCRPHVAEADVRPGLHLVRVAAPGHRADARVAALDDALDDAGELRLDLAADPSAPLGPWWTAGALDPESASARAAVQARAGAAQVVFLERGDAGWVARLMRAGRLRRVARADLAADAAVQALAAPTTPPPVEKPPRRRTALWLGLGGAALVAVGLGLGLGLGLRPPSDARLQLVVP